MGKDKYVFQGTGLTPEEKKLGQKRFNDYLNSFPHLTKTLANQQALEELVWAEVIQERIKQQYSAFGENEAESIPVSLQKSTLDGLNMIFEMKGKLGMFEAPVAMDGFEKIQDIFDRGKEYRKAHVDDFKVTCPDCAKTFVLKHRTKGYEIVISPFFEDKVIRNRPLFKLYKDGVVTKEEAADIMEVSPHFIDWLEQKYYSFGMPPKSEPELPDPSPEA
jgi:hypothetical protein